MSTRNGVDRRESRLRAKMSNELTAACPGWTRFGKEYVITWMVAAYEWGNRNGRKQKPSKGKRRG